MARTRELGPYEVWSLRAHVQRTLAFYNLIDRKTRKKWTQRIKQMLKCGQNRQNETDGLSACVCVCASANELNRKEKWNWIGNKAPTLLNESGSNRKFNILCIQSETRFAAVRKTCECVCVCVFACMCGSIRLIRGQLPSHICTGAGARSGVEATTQTVGPRARSSQLSRDFNNEQNRMWIEIEMEN